MHRHAAGAGTDQQAGNGSRAHFAGAAEALARPLGDLQGEVEQCVTHADLEQAGREFADLTETNDHRPARFAVSFFIEEQGMGPRLAGV